MEDDFSTVSVAGEYESSCGYCGSEKSSVAFGMTAKRLTVQTYQDLLDRGWRRSGTWLYLPVYDKTCCPCYTHRLDVTKFIPNKAQLKASRKFENYLQNNSRQGGEDGVPSQTACMSSQGIVESQKPINKDAQHQKELTALAKQLERAAKELKAEGILPAELKLPPAKVQTPKLAAVSSSGVSYTSPFAFPLAAAVAKGSTRRLPAQQIAELLAARVQLDGEAVVHAVKGHLNFCSTSACTSTEQAEDGAQSTEGLSPSHEVMQDSGAERDSQPGQDNAHAINVDNQRKQPGQAETTHQGGKSRRGVKRQASSLGGSRRELRIVTKRSSSQLVAVEFPLYRKYQVSQHNDPPYKVTPASFKRFLIDSPLVYVPPLEDFTCRVDSSVWLRIFPSAVLDRCKYFFWDPDLAHLSLGRISALKEIEWVAAAHASCPGLKYYYMGFYIHTCPKMQYKVGFAPADLLCPRELVWIPFARIKGFLDEGLGRALSDAPGSTQDLSGESIPTHLHMLSNGKEKADMLSLRLMRSGPQPRGQPLSLAEHLTLGALNPTFVELYSETLMQLAQGVGPIAKGLVIVV